MPGRGRARDRFTTGGLAGQIASISVNPINIAREKTSGIDVAFRGTLPTSFGDFTLSLAHSHVLKHSFQQYPGDPIENKLAFDSGFYLPRDKSNGSISWANEGLQFTVSGTRLGKLPNYDEDAFLKASYLFNATMQYDFTDHMRGVADDPESVRYQPGEGPNLVGLSLLQYQLVRQRRTQCLPAAHLQTGGSSVITQIVGHRLNQSIEFLNGFGQKFWLNGEGR